MSRFLLGWLFVLLGVFLQMWSVRWGGPEAAIAVGRPFVLFGVLSMLLGIPQMLRGDAP